MPHTIKNMRITFWGVQGTFPIFPSPPEVQAFARRIATDAIERVLADIEQHRNPADAVPGSAAPAPAESDGHPPRIDGNALLNSHRNDATIDAYQRQLGMVNLPIYGGETTCIEVETGDGNTLIFDAGSGMRFCSTNLEQRFEGNDDRQIHLFGSHEHLDHRSGLPLARVCFAQPPFNVNVYGGYQFLHALDDHYGIFSRKLQSSAHRNDPIDYTLMSARFKAIELRGSEIDYDTSPDRLPCDVRSASVPIRIGETLVTPFEVYHGPTRCLGYKVQCRGKSFVFCTDHELRHGTDPADPQQLRSEAAERRVQELSHEVDAAYFDGQYFMSEYLGLTGIGASPAVPRIDWGHSCIEDVLLRAQQCRIQRTYIGHHEPAREWPEKLELDTRLAALGKQQARHIELARAGTVIDL